MQEHRKSEETGFWAGLARSLCELSEQADFAQRGRASSAFQGCEAEPSTSRLWPVGGHPERGVPDAGQINPTPTISALLAQVQGDSPTVRHGGSVTHLCPTAQRDFIQ